MHSLLLVGCGKMGGALLARWQEKFPSAKFHVIEPKLDVKNSGALKHYKNLGELGADVAPEVIVFAVKPQELNALLPEYKKRFAEKHTLYLSIAAGKSLAFFTAGLGPHAHVVRAMPNTPALIGEGVTVLCAASTVPAAGKKIAEQLMQAVGHAEWVEDERLMDAVTAVSGSGPAYAFLFMESLAKAGIAAGLSADMAKTLAIKTLCGSAMLAGESHESLEQLRKNVTSPGGTTEAALSILMKDGQFQALVENAVKKAAERARELDK